MITILLSKTKMKSGIVLSGVMALLTGCTNLDTEILTDFPADVPIVSGEIYRAKHGSFEDGPGFVVDVLTTLTCEEVFAFYADVVGPRGNGDVRVETTCGDTATRYAVHLGQKGTEGLNMDQYNRLLKETEGLNIGQFHELIKD
ncbi:MAG: hypothetical protein ABGY96_04070 [bacterium]|nr:hypothetical protein [Gammaproteobacteria bacterium]